MPKRRQKDSNLHAITAPHFQYGALPLSDDGIILSVEMTLTDHASCFQSNFLTNILLKTLDKISMRCPLRHIRVSADVACYFRTHCVLVA